MSFSFLRIKALTVQPPQGYAIFEERKVLRRLTRLICGLALFFCLQPAFCGEKEELAEILLLDSQIFQSLEKGKTDKRDRKAVEDLVEKYRTFIKKYPENVDARNYLGGLYYDLGMPEKAFQEWSTGLRMDPDHPYLHNNIAEYYAHTSGEPARAIAEVRKAVGLKDDVAIFHFNLANYYDLFRYVVLEEFKSLDAVFRECLKEYQKACELEPSNFDFAFVYAATLTYSPVVWGIEDPSSPSEKVAAWQRCLLLAPDTTRKELITKILQKLR